MFAEHTGSGDRAVGFGAKEKAAEAVHAQSMGLDGSENHRKYPSQGAGHLGTMAAVGRGIPPWHEQRAPGRARGMSRLAPPYPCKITGRVQPGVSR